MALVFSVNSVLSVAAVITQTRNIEFFRTGTIYMHNQINREGKPT